MELVTAEASQTVAPRRLLWTAHAAVWLLALLAARLSRVGSQLEVHITGRNNAEIAPDHLRMILTAPTTEFKLVAMIGVLASLVLALLLWKPSPRALRWLTASIALIGALVYVAGYGMR